MESVGSTILCLSYWHILIVLVSTILSINYRDIPIEMCCVLIGSFSSLSTVSSGLCEPAFVLQHEHEGPSRQDLQVLHWNSSL